MTGEQKPGGLEVARIVACHLPLPDCPDAVCVPVTITAGDLRAIYAALTTPAEPAEARIRELEAECDASMREIATLREEADAAEAKLARAVEGLERIVHWRVEMTGTPVDTEAANAWAMTFDTAATEASQTLAALQQEGE